MALFNKTIELGANHKAIWYKRMIATFFDGVVLFLTTYLFFYLINLTPIADHAKGYREEMTLIEDEAKLDTGYGYKVVVKQGEEGNYYLHYDEGNDEYYIVKNVQYPSSEITTAYQTILKENNKYSDLTFSYLINNYGMLFGAGFVSELIFLFVVPLANKKRATLGQLLCGLQLISTKRNDKAAWYQLLGRLFFIYIIESVVPYLIMGMWILLVVPLITLLIRFFNDNSRSLYDFVTVTKLIEGKTFLPPAYDDEKDDVIDVTPTEEKKEETITNHKESEE